VGGEPTSHCRPGDKDITSDGKRQGIAPGDEEKGPEALDALTTAGEGAETTAGAAARADSDPNGTGAGGVTAGPGAENGGSNGHGGVEGAEPEPAVTTQMAAIDAPPPGDAEPTAPTDPTAAGPPAPDDRPPPGEPEPAVTTQMPVVDAPAPADEPSPTAAPTTFVARTGGAYRDEPPFGSGERPAAHGPGGAPSGERPAAYGPGGAPSGDRFTAVPGGSGERPAADAAGGSGERPRHFRSSDEIPAERGRLPISADTRKLALMLAPVGLLVLLVLAWAVDTATHSGQVVRNVELSGRSIDGTSEDELPRLVEGLAEDMEARTVTITSGDRVYEAKAGELGLSVDQKATVEAAMDAGRGGAFPLRPFSWFGSFFSPSEVSLELTMTESDTAATLQRLQGTDHTQPVEPLIQNTANGFVLVKGQPGTGISIEEVASELRRKAAADPEGPIEIDAEPQDMAPNFTDEQGQQLADRANDMTADGMTLKAGGTSTPVPAATLRGWIHQTVTDGQLDLAFDTEKATQELPTVMANVAKDPQDATVEMGPDGKPRVVPHVDGVTCCGENSADVIWQGLRDGQAEVELEATVAEPEWTTAEVEQWKVVAPVGGNRGWQDGHEVTAGQPAGFTTYHAAGQPRVRNIQKIADDVRGAVIPPGGEFSINDHVGTRTYEKGYIDAGAIRNGLHVEEVGGGISQFATTMFNAAFFAGFDILEYQTHSEYFSRYPPGREATMGLPSTGPDLRIRNNSPYGVLVWTSYTPTSITVTFYSSPHATGEQTGISETMNGVCRIVTTTRTRTFPDGSTKQDTFRSQPYRPEGKRCDGTVIPPPPPPTP
jgi:vancomycin resistance protein YoaR